MAFSRWGRPNKYNAKKVQKAGIWFASRLESAVHDILLLQEKAGEIRDIKCQPQVYLTEAKIGYRPDFSYVDEKTGQTVYVEAKGVEVETWLIKKKLWKCYGLGPLFIFKGRHDKPYLREVIIPKPGGQTTD